MAGPQVVTGYEPSGSGWQFIDDRIVATGQPGVQVVMERQDATVVEIAGIDLWRAIAIDQIVRQYAQRGKQVFYLSRWKQPPPILGTGLATYRGIVVRTV